MAQADVRRSPVLVVEDDHRVQELVRLALSDAYDVKQATTGGEALAILHRERVAAVVLDYRLPDRTGLEVLNDIRATEPRLPVIMMTGYGSEWVCASAFKLGVTDYFPKPVDVFDLVHCVRRVLAPASGDSPGDAGAEGNQPPALPGPLARRPDMPIQMAVHIIQHRYWSSLSLAQVANEVGMSKYRLSHRFTQVMGVPFREYLLRVRLERAKDLLSAGPASITEVAQGVGFSDLPRFDKLFRRYTGSTPSAYRSQSLPPSNSQ